MRTIAITGSASGMGAALSGRLTAAGDRVIGVDLRNADVEADLGTSAGRAQAIERVTELSDGALDGLVTLAGLAGLPERPASLLISVNYFGTVELLAGLRPLLANGHRCRGGGDQLQLHHLPARSRRGAHRQLPRGRRGGDAVRSRATASRSAPIR